MSLSYRKRALKFWLQLLVVAGILPIGQIAYAQQKTAFRNQATLDSYKDQTGFSQPPVQSQAAMAKHSRTMLASALAYMTLPMELTWAP
jgi:hypothetical protein